MQGAATSRHSRSGIGQGRGSWASITAGSAAVRPSASPAPVIIEREGCLCLVLPPESRVTLPDVAVAIGQLGGNEAQWQPFMHNGHIVLQALTSGAGIEAEKARLLSEGLQIKSIKAKCSPLVNSANSKDIIEGRIEGLNGSQDGQQLMKDQLTALGTLITFNLETFPGSNGVPTGIATFLLDIHAKGKAPKSHYILDFGTWSNHVRVSILGRQKFCYYCREASHLRRECPHAPACTHCGSTVHSSLRCTARKPSAVHPTSSSSAASITPPASTTPSVQRPSEVLPPSATPVDPATTQILETPELGNTMHSPSNEGSQESRPTSPPAASPASSHARSWADQMEEDDGEEGEAREIESMLSTQRIELTQDDTFQPVKSKASRRAESLRARIQASAPKQPRSKRPRNE
ncbi:hypothetical protein P389DRAFT_197569 [Cystobasidium minutum MCA 4210]|uniref:uncharacterized protein n=1 Tax=Cystobasidium minutum MCA 4210 TaxID=1397322 RepID=UPI0034CD6EB0|eukprot:jgi/Rhomi1/197569/gm1.5783_g